MDFALTISTFLKTESLDNINLTGLKSTFQAQTISNFSVGSIAAKLLEILDY